MTLQRLVSVACFGLVLALSLPAGATAAARIAVEPPDEEIATLLTSVIDTGVELAALAPSEYGELLRLQRDRIAAVLRALGHFGAQVTVLSGDELIDLDGVVDVAAAQRPSERDVTFVAAPGPVYRIRSFRVVHAAPEGTAASSEVGDVVGLPATAEIFAIVESDWRSFIQDLGHPMAFAVGREVSPDDAAEVVDVELTANVGPIVRLGDVQFRGAEYTDRAALQATVRFSPGDRYRRDTLWELSRAIERLPGVDAVNVRLAPFPDNDGTYAVVVTLVETPRPRLPNYREILGALLLGGAATAIALVQVSRVRRADTSPWSSHWYAVVVGGLLASGTVFAALRILDFLG